jgi:hypothetical protein
MRRVQATGGAKASSSDERSDLLAPKRKTAARHRLNPEHWKTRGLALALAPPGRDSELVKPDRNKQGHLVLERT